ncbi:4157_t:CDS:2 [Entrophospora sp. SA101]|nr:1453_t:CDS:2 [Entrophospora sp. SA101]CAJ0625612.1 4157_t:CDS:2 [Entrophospora sp. SA101]CAJ0907066.1 12047_t:CDS:2 [Entrophospora sp. SA101]
MILQRALIVLFVILAGAFTITISANNVTVEVGKNGLKFIPQKVIFKFVNPNIKHNVVQSDSEASCTNSTKPDAFASEGFSQSDFIVKINQDNGALYYYCSVANHCSVGGMWGVINIQPTNNNSSKSGAAESSSTSITLATSIVLLSSLFMAMFMV